ncbi:MAG: exodeoxyribonuclease VII large subunit [Alphaproteobacteria bacterium]|nr:exodeoxyribonuclease VII large subunit [Alphaproteobacteria bacterium]
MNRSSPEYQKAPGTGGNAPEMTVSEISRLLKRTVEEAFSYVRVRGEISGFKRAASGHLYMTLKDESSVIDGVCWRGAAQRLATQPEDGLEVIVTGKLTTYPGRSKYQIVIETMEPAGEGALLKLLEDRKRALEAEGLFDPARKKPIPFLPERIGVVTSPTGAVIRDILHRLDDRFPRPVLLWPVPVQGEGAAEKIAAAIRGFNELDETGGAPRPDVIIVARGGGSLEDLWAFNEEVVVRAAAASAIPLISAVGHETDVTLIDFASDKRAPTPTAAAELVVPVRRELALSVRDLERRSGGALLRLLDRASVRLDGLARGLPDPAAILDARAQRLDDFSERLTNAIRRRLQREGEATVGLAARLRHPGQVLAAQAERAAQASERLSRLAARNIQSQTRRFRESRLDDRLDRALNATITVKETALKQIAPRLNGVSYENVLKRGYAILRDEAGGVLMDAAAVQAGQGLSVQLRDGSVAATASGSAPKSTPAAKPKRKPKADNERQGSLL